MSNRNKKLVEQINAAFARGDVEGFLSCCADDVDEAVASDPNYGPAYARLADAYILLAMTSDVPPREAFPAARTGARARDRSEPTNLAVVHLGLGEYNEALDWLEKAYQARDMLLTFLIVGPQWETPAGHPRFTDC